MNEIILAYALIKSIYETSKDYLDVFVPFILISFPENQKECNVEVLSKGITTKIGIDIPKHVFDTIITRAVRRGYLKRSQNKYILQEKGYRLTQGMVSKQNDEKGRVNSLIENIKDFIKSKYSNTLSSEEILEILNSFIKRYQFPLITFFNPEIVMEEELESNFDREYFYLIEYLKLAKDQKPNTFETFKRIFYGIIISMVLKRDNISEVNKKFSKLQIFFDTNFMFSIMDLHYANICKPVKELFNLLKKYNFHLKVFDFTIEEMVRVLSGYRKESHKYFPNIKVNSIYSNLKSKGWTSEDCLGFISNIEKRIYDYGIEIEYTEIDLNKWEIPCNENYTTISQYKPDQNLLGQKHDICAIEKIRQIRKRPQRELENCIALLLTSDLKLAKFNFVELGHKDNLTVCEVISDRFLTTLLWLKNPQIVKELPLEMILSTQSEILVDRAVWDRFHENVQKLKKISRVSDEDISTLFYYRQITQDLAQISNPEEITSEFILEEIEKSKKEMEEEVKRMIEKEKKKVEERYTEEMGKKYIEYLDKIENIKSNLRHKAGKKAKICSNCSWGLPPMLFIIGVCVIIKFKSITYTYISLILSVLSFFGIKCNIFNAREKIYDI